MQISLRPSLLRVAARVLLRAAVSCVAVAASQVGMAGPAAADVVRNEQWQLKALDARTAWQLSTGHGVVVGVVDSGVDASHPDLVGQVLAGADFVDEGGDGRQDPVGHGTTVAGLIAGRSDDTRGVVGIAPNAKILPVRVLDRNNRYEDPRTVAKGLRWAVDHGATIVNLSLGGAARSDVLADALRYAAERDVVVIACTGNVVAEDVSREVWYPAREPGVVAVAGLVGNGRVTGTKTPPVTASPSASGGAGGGQPEALWSGSLTGPQTVLTAPAVDLVGAKPGGGYWRVQGTSFAAPLVAATASLIRARFPGISAANVVNRLISTARDLGPNGRDEQFGYGVVSPPTALRAEVAEVAGNPLTSTNVDRSAGAPGGAGGPPGGPSTVPTPTSPSPEEASGESTLGAQHRTAPSGPPLWPSVGLGGLVTAVVFVAGVLVLLWRRRERTGVVEPSTSLGERHR